MSTRLLLIDPDIDFIVTIKQALEETGDFQVSLATNSLTASEALQQNAHDIAVITFDIVEMDILELLQLLRQIQLKLPVLVTPSTQAQHERVHLLDVQGILTKPYSARDLIPIIRAVFERLHPQVKITPPPTAPNTDDFVSPEISATRLDRDDQPTAVLSLKQPLPELLNQAEREKLQDQLQQLDTGNLTEAANILKEFEALERVQSGPSDETRRLDDTDTLDNLRQHEPASMDEVLTYQAQDETHRLDDTDTLDNLRQHEPASMDEVLTYQAPDETHRLDDTDVLDNLRQHEPASMDEVLTYQAPDETRRLDDSRTQNDVIQDQGWDVRDRASTRRISPDHDETLSLAHDLDAPSYPAAADDEQGLAGFEDVLDAVAQLQPTDYEPSPDQQGFHELVDSMRGTDQRGVHRTRLEKLIASIAADAEQGQTSPSSPAASDTLDYVLDAIRQGISPIPTGANKTEIGDATIGEVIDGLFEPSFEGVLAALAGEKIEEEAFDEPTYGMQGAEESLKPQASDLFTPEEMSTDKDRPAWLDAYEVAAVDPAPVSRTEPATVKSFADLVLEELPISTEDSSRFPATTALTAVTKSESLDGFSLDDLLIQIEGQLPPARKRYPRLKALPSWGLAETFIGAQDIDAMFDHVEGVKADPLAPLEIATMLDDEDPVTFAAELPEEIRSTPFENPSDPASPQDTQPSAVHSATLDSVPAQEDAADFTLAEELLAVDDFAYAATSDDMESDEEIAEAFFAGVRAAAPYDLLADGAAPDDMAGTAIDDLIDDVVGDRVGDTAEEVELDDRMVEEPFFTEEDLLPEADIQADAGTDVRIDIEKVFSFEDDFETADEVEPFFAAEDQLPEADIQADAETDVRIDAEEEIFFEDDFETVDEDFAAETYATPVPTEPVLVDERAVEFADEDVTDEELIDERVTFDAFAPDDIAEQEEYLVPVPVAQAARILEGESFVEDSAFAGEEDGAEDALIAQTAILLTQFSLESSAQAIMLSSSGTLLAEAGDLSEAMMMELFKIVDEGWQTSTTTSDALIKHIELPEAGKFLLYSMQVEHNQVLSMIFHADMPVRTIRQQAQRLSISLDLVPEEPEPESVQTRPNRPNDLYPPQGGQVAIDDYTFAADDHRSSAVEHGTKTESYTTYTCLWLLYDPGQELLDDFATDLQAWIQELAEENAWELEGLDVQSDTIILTLRTLQKDLPDHVIMYLMDQTTQLSAKHYADLVNGAPLWTDGYYLVSPPRELTEREIARFITYQRQAQMN